MATSTASFQVYAAPKRSVPQEQPVELDSPKNAVGASCYDPDCGRTFHWYPMPAKAVSGTKCYDCGGQLIYNHRTKRATYKGSDSCICNGCTPADLATNAKDSARGRK